MLGRYISAKHTPTKKDCEPSHVFGAIDLKTLIPTNLTKLMPVLLAKLNTSPASWSTIIQDTMDELKRSRDETDIHLPKNSFIEALWMFSWFFRMDSNCYQQVPFAWRVNKRPDIALPSKHDDFFFLQN